ncbi:nitrous oxidase accessory protein [Paenibacillus sp. UNCCL117]|uniref:right-handed parallel beta-helix repeat-containing protein n=1 Tax=unclassified Paenibacillus TaxID=185978 RepID=UPI00088257BA|nr:MULTISPECIES: NosD domain-containing protein [unclassified Paenibacillus]SDC92760.1 nitrous oxidase accessory protein [Paenibacillus sp. cl123]SFW29411.1 nitrous oxidase accessory protein [Paenibacillus sp. UNCCL117]
MNRQFRRLGFTGCLAVCLWLAAGAGVHAAASAVLRADLQRQIDATPENGTLVLQEGVYAGGAIIGKRIRLEAQGQVRIVGDGTSPALHIQADRVHVRGVELVQGGESEEAAAVLVTGSGALLEELDIRTQAFGIVMRDNERSEIRRTQIRWLGDGEDGMAAGPGELPDKRNGIDLFNSHDNRIHDNDVSSMNDGIYLESSHRNLVENNRIEHSRYGIHCMYTDGTVVRGNRGAFNITGAMVMGVKDAEVTGNTFTKQSESVNSQGLLFFDVETSRIAGNKVEGNRVGLYVEQSNRNEFSGNDVLRNFVGVQFLESEGNRLTGNRFIGNVIESQADDSANNAFSGNYWEAFNGLDTNGDGSSELAYAMNPFFQRLTSAAPAYQLFFQSPGMLFLESMFTEGREGWSVDDAPLMQPALAGTALQEGDRSGGPARNGTLALGVLLLAASAGTTYYLGVRRK